MYLDSILLVASLLAAAHNSIASCLHGTSFLPRRMEHGRVAVSTFGYTGLRGPLNWAALSPANVPCATSNVQSPINIDHAAVAAASASRVKIVIPSVHEAEFENLGTTLEVIVGGVSVVDGRNFTLKQFHFHTPSEHRVREE